MGLYEPLRGMFHRMLDGGESSPGIVVKVLAGLAAGATGAAIANPTDLVKVRMQAAAKGKTAHAYKGTLDAFAVIYRQEGLAGLYRGVGPTTQRAMLLTATQLASYDHIKQAVTRSGVEDGLPLHFAVSMIAGMTRHCMRP